MDDYGESAMVALLPMTDDWCKIECPHLTLVYCGEINDLPSSAFNEIAKDAASIAMLARPITLRVTDVDVFGEGDEQVDVLKMRPIPELMAMHNMVKRWNASQYDFNPHCTIGPVGSSNEIRDRIGIPRMLAFDKVLVSWGKDDLAFSLRR